MTTLTVTPLGDNPTPSFNIEVRSCFDKRDLMAELVKLGKLDENYGGSDIVLDEICNFPPAWEMGDFWGARLFVFTLPDNPLI